MSNHHHHDLEGKIDFKTMLRKTFEFTELKTKELIDSICIQTNWHILDVGAGTGAMAPLLLEKLQGGSGSVTLMEPADLMEPDLKQLQDENPNKVIYRKSSIEDRNYGCEKDPTGFDMIFARYRFVVFQLFRSLCF